MKLKSASAVVAASAAMMFAQSASVPPPPQAAKAGFTKLVLNEDFSHFDLNNPSPNGVAWKKQLNYGHPPPDEYFSVSNGVLTITTPPDSRKGVRSTLTTLGAPPPWQKDFQFGYYEARIRFDWNPDNGDVFWLQSAVPEERAANHTGYSGTQWCEIDVFEDQPNPRTYIGTVHGWQDGKRVQFLTNRIPLPDGTSLSDWNTFGTLWQPGKISWYLNNKLVASSPAPPICDHDKLSLVIGATKNKESDEVQKLQVNWVRVYQ